jgi:hypothetical protein
VLPSICTILYHVPVSREAAFKPSIIFAACAHDAPFHRCTSKPPMYSLQTTKRRGFDCPTNILVTSQKGKLTCVVDVHSSAFESSFLDGQRRATCSCGVGSLAINRHRHRRSKRHSAGMALNFAFFIPGALPAHDHTRDAHFMVSNVLSSALETRRPTSV